MTDGSSKLMPEQQQIYKNKFGQHYVAVQWQPQIMSRTQRRKLQFKPRSER